MVGTKVEQQGIIRHGAKMLYAVAQRHGAEVHRGGAQGLRRRLLRDERPRLRAGPPGGLAGRGDRRDGRRRGWSPSRRASCSQGAESPEAAKAMKEELAASLRQHISIYRAAAMAMVDDVIDPARHAAAAGPSAQAHGEQEGRAALPPPGDLPGLTRASTASPRGWRRRSTGTPRACRPRRACPRRSPVRRKPASSCPPI